MTMDTLKEDKYIKKKVKKECKKVASDLFKQGCADPDALLVKMYDVMTSINQKIIEKIGKKPSLV